MKAHEYAYSIFVGLLTAAIGGITHNYWWGVFVFAIGVGLYSGYLSDKDD